MCRLRLSCCLLGWFALLPASAYAQSDATRAAARGLGAEGVEAFQAGDVAVAVDKLERAFKVLRVPSLGLWSARALSKQGKLVEASERYLEVARLDASTGDAAVQKQAQEDAAREQELLAARIPTVTVTVKGAGPDLKVMLDGAPVPNELLGARQPVNPGPHRLEASSAGRQLTRELSASEGQPLALTLDFADAAPAPTAAATSAPKPATPQSASQPVPTGVWLGVALAGAGAATGGVAAFVASQKRKDLNCPNDLCPNSERDEGESYNSLLTVSTIGFIAGGVGLAVAGTFWLTRPKPREAQARVEPWLGIGAAGVRGSF